MAIKNSQTEIDYVKQMKSSKLPFSIKLVRIYIKVLFKLSKKRSAKLVTKLFITPQRKVLRSDQLEYYNSGKSEFIKFNEKDIFIFTKGEGPKILLAHGWGSNSYIFRFIIDALVEAGFSTVTLDYPAHGQSSGKQTTVVETSELVKSVANTHGPFNGIIAYSFGGPTILRAMELGLKTDNLVLLSSPTRIESIFNPFFSMLDIKPELQELFINELIAISEIDRNRLSPLNMEFDKSVSTLIIHDNNDEIISLRDAEIINNELDNSNLIVTSNLGHRGVPRNDIVVQQIVNFIASESIKIKV